MMHGPCGEANPTCPCMMNGKCTKYYPRPYTSSTTMDSDGYALYRRRDTGITVEFNGIHLGNRHVVPYNRGLLVKYQAHVNVEQCNRSQTIKYLFKYTGKGPDKVTAVLERIDGHNNAAEMPPTTVQEPQLNEVKITSHADMYLPLSPVGGYLSSQYTTENHMCSACSSISRTNKRYGSMTMNLYLRSWIGSGQMGSCSSNGY